MPKEKKISKKEKYRLCFFLTSFLIATHAVFWIAEMPAFDLIASVPFIVASMASVALVISIRAIRAVPVVRVVNVVRVVVPHAPSRARRR